MDGMEKVVVDGPGFPYVTMYLIKGKAGLGLASLAGSRSTSMQHQWGGCSRIERTARRIAQGAVDCSGIKVTTIVIQVRFG